MINLIFATVEELDKIIEEALGENEECDNPSTGQIKESETTEALETFGNDFDLDTKTIKKSLHGKIAELKAENTKLKEDIKILQDSNYNLEFLNKSLNSDIKVYKALLDDYKGSIKAIQRVLNSLK